MPNFEVKSDFIDAESGDLIKAGQPFEVDDVERIEKLKGAGVIGKEIKPSNDGEEDLKHVGAGYYELPNGEKVRGKEKALEALEALKNSQEEEDDEEDQENGVTDEGGEDDGAENSDSTDEGSGASGSDNG